jgi:hypothetical protein
MKMIQCSKLVQFECPACGYLVKAEDGAEIDCPKCDPKNKGWYSDMLHNQTSGKQEAPK